MSKSSSSTPSTAGDVHKDDAQVPNDVSKAPASRADSSSKGPDGEDILLFLIASRLLSALVLQTFFQPDEYFQALEPAWQLAFGQDSGAWITWVSVK